MGLKRAKRDRWIMGICGGIGHTYGVSPNIVRLITVVVAVLIPGISVIPVALIYILLGAILPESDAF